MAKVISVLRVPVGALAVAPDPPNRAITATAKIRGINKKLVAVFEYLGRLDMPLPLPADVIAVEVVDRLLPIFIK